MNELVEAKNAVLLSEANLKVLEDDLVQRLHDEVEQVSVFLLGYVYLENGLEDTEHVAIRSSL